MKTLLAVRHAKSSWSNFGEPDFDRSLNERGKKDAPEMAERIITKNIKIEKFISSPAKRARMTCEAFCDVNNYKKSDILFIDKLYHAPSHIIYQAINDLTISDDVIAIFTHNSGITDFVNTLCDTIVIDNMPTCAVFAVQADIKAWSEFETAEKTLLFYDYPKLLKS